jgi:hypothetical protein
MRKGETSRLEEFWRNQKDFGPGTRIQDGDRQGFILDWNVSNTFPLRGNFSVLYDDGNYKEYDVSYFRYLRKSLNSAYRWMNDSSLVKNSYKEYCENLFLGKLISENE